MPYTTDVNEEIVNFLSRAQTKLAELSKVVAEKVDKRRPYLSYSAEVDLGYELDCFIRALDNNYNDWTEAEIIRYIHFWDNRAKVTNYPYVQRERFNVNINFD
jgi:hypothetical protein